jgi:thiamine biosynthesis lipoprotein
MQFTDAFRAMDTNIDAIVEAPFPPTDAFISLRLLFEEQEQRFSRFRATSLLSRLNRGETVGDALFVKACRLAVEAHRFTGGLYNPMVLPALEEAGYSKTFSEVAGGLPREQAVPNPADCLVFDGDSVRLERGAIDLGGIVKGWTVDLAFELLEPRYPDLFVNAGGDLRCAGSEEGIDGWLVAIAGRAGEAALREEVMRGAVATSTTRKRRWRTAGGGEAHHLIDPRTGVPAESPFEQVTAWAPEAWHAECWTKAVLIGGTPALGTARAAGLRVLAVTSDGDLVER